MCTQTGGGGEEDKLNTVEILQVNKWSVCLDGKSLVRTQAEDSETVQALVTWCAFSTRAAATN